MKNICHLIDCMEFMRGLPDNHYDLAIVDPPYGIGADKGTDGSSPSVRYDPRDNKKIIRNTYRGDWDGNIPSYDYFQLVLAKSALCILWGGNFFAHLLPRSTHWIFWNKKNPMPSLGDGEIAYTTSDRKSVKEFVLPYWGHQTAGETCRIHPTQKPVALYKFLLSTYAKPGDTIFDSHVGSGSIRIACHDLDFSFEGCEIDADYHAAQEARFQKHTDQLRLF